MDLMLYLDASGSGSCDLTIYNVKSSDESPDGIIVCDIALSDEHIWKGTGKRAFSINHLF
jgi:hypothetical protein